MDAQQRMFDDAVWIWLVASFATFAFVKALSDITSHPWKGDQ